MPIKPLVTIDGGRIILNKEEVGHIFFSVPTAYTRKRFLLEILAGDTGSVEKVLDKLKVPDKFYSTYVDEIKLRKAFRGKGLGTQVFEALFQDVKKPCLVCLNPGEITSGESKVSIATLKKFYTKLGFTVFQSGGGETLALKSLK